MSAVNAGLEVLGLSDAIQTLLGLFHEVWAEHEGANSPTMPLIPRGRTDEAPAIRGNQSTSPYESAVTAIMDPKQGEHGRVIQHSTPAFAFLGLAELHWITWFLTALAFVAGVQILEWRRRKALDQLTQVQRRFLQSEEWLRLAQEAGRIGVWEVTSDKSVRYSQQELALCGFDPARTDVTYEEFLSMVHPDDRKLLEVTPDGPPEEHVDLEIRFIRPDGSTRWLLSKGKTTRDSEQGTWQKIGIHVDITEQKALSRD